MKYSRVFGILEMELGRHLTFSYSISEHRTRPGSTTIRSGDEFVFTVWALNDSAIPLRRIQGTITPTSLARFENGDFHLRRLGPHRKKQVGRLTARIVGNSGRGILRFDQIGMVRVSVEPDLSRFRVEKSRPLQYEQTA